MQQQINLYVAELRAEAKRFGAVTMLYAVTAVLFAMSLTYAFSSYKLKNIDHELQIIGMHEAAVGQQLVELSAAVQQVSAEMTWSERLDEAVRLLQEKQLVLGLVQSSALGDTKGFSRYLRSLARQDTDGLMLNRIQLSAFGDRTRLEGKALRADLVPSYLQTLANEPPFAQQKFHQFQISGSAESDNEIVTFSLNSETLASSDSRTLR